MRRGYKPGWARATQKEREKIREEFSDDPDELAEEIYNLRNEVENLQNEIRNHKC